jgi:hypothetical protein
MRHEIDEMIDIAIYFEIKTPPTIDASLPDVSGLIVFLGPEGGVAEIGDQEFDTPLKRSLDVRWGVLIALSKAFGVVETHSGFFGPSGFLRGIAQRTDQILSGMKRPIDSTPFDVFQALLNALVYKVSGSKDNLPLLKFNLQIVSCLKPKLVVDLLGDDNLTTCPDLDHGHGCSPFLF